MDKMARLIMQGIPETAEVKEKRVMLDWGSPASTLWVGLPAMLIVSLVVASVEKLGRDASDILTAVVIFAMGLWLLVYRPMSRGVGFRFKRYEAILGVISIILGAWRLITVWYWATSP